VRSVESLTWEFRHDYQALQSPCTVRCQTGNGTETDQYTDLDIELTTSGRTTPETKHTAVQRGGSSFIPICYSVSLFKHKAISSQQKP